MLSVFMPSTFVYSLCSCIVLKALFVALFDLVRGSVNGFLMLSICVDPLNEGKDSMIGWLVCSHRQRDWGGVLLRKVVRLFTQA